MTARYTASFSLGFSPTLDTNRTNNASLNRVYRARFTSFNARRPEFIEYKASWSLVENVILQYKTYASRRTPPEPECSDNIDGHRPSEVRE
jgi:hypothetical protein